MMAGTAGSAARDALREDVHCWSALLLGSCRTMEGHVDMVCVKCVEVFIVPPRVLEEVEDAKKLQWPSASCEE